MSKLYTKYMELKKSNPDSVYLFKSGIFFLALQEDATLLSNELNLKVTNLTSDVLKCGFPISKEEHYIKFLQAKKIPFTIIDDLYGIVENYSDYMNNEKIKKIINELINIDFNNITFKDAYEILLSTSNSLKKIYK